MTSEEHFDKIDHCPALTTVHAISGKWKTRILWLIRSGEIGFNELRRSLKKVSPKVLTEQLRQLEAEGIIYHQRIHEGGVLVSKYGFTEYGQTLIPVLDIMGHWGVIHERRADVD